MALDGDGRMTTVDRVFLTRLRRVGTVEGISTLVLFGIAMPLKYVGGLPHRGLDRRADPRSPLYAPDGGCSIPASSACHSPANSRYGESWGAVIPFGPFVVDRWLARSHPG